MLVGGTGREPWVAQGSLYDGFDATDTDPIAGWTTLGSPDTVSTNTDEDSILKVAETGAGSNNVVGIYKSWSPSAGKFVETWLTDRVFKDSASSYVGMFVGEAGGAGKLLLMGIGRYGSAWDDKFVNFLYPNRTTYGSEPASITGPWRPPFGIRMVYNSSSSVDVFLSHGGGGWIKLAAAINPGFTIGIAGVGGDMSASGFSTEAYFDYFNDG